MKNYRAVSRREPEINQKDCLPFYQALLLDICGTLWQTRSKKRQLIVLSLKNIFEWARLSNSECYSPGRQRLKSDIIKVYKIMILLVYRFRKEAIIKEIKGRIALGVSLKW